MVTAYVLTKKQKKFALSLLETKYSFVGKHIYFWKKSKIEKYTCQTSVKEVCLQVSGLLII